MNEDRLFNSLPRDNIAYKQLFDINRTIQLIRATGTFYTKSLIKLDWLLVTPYCGDNDICSAIKIFQYTHKRYERVRGREIEKVKSPAHSLKFYKFSAK